MADFDGFRISIVFKLLGHVRWWIIVTCTVYVRFWWILCSNILYKFSCEHGILNLPKSTKKLVVDCLADSGYVQYLHWRILMEFRTPAFCVWKNLWILVDSGYFLVKIPKGLGLKQPQILFMFKVKYVDSIVMLVRLDLNLIFQHKCEVSEMFLTTTLNRCHSKFIVYVI